MPQLFSIKHFLAAAPLVLCLFFSLSSIAALAEHEPVQAQNALTEEKSSIKNDCITSLKQLDDLFSQFPPYWASVLKTEIDEQLKSFNDEPLTYSVTEFLTWLFYKIKQEHKVSIQEAQFNSHPVYYIALGYLAFYRLAVDGSEGYIWNKEKRQWVDLKSESIRHLEALWRMKKKYQPRSWAMLPVTAPAVNTITVKPSETAQQKPVFPTSPPLSATINKHIKERLWKINQKLQESSLSVLLSQPLIFDPHNPVVTLQTIVSQLTQLILHGSQINEVKLPKNRIISPDKNDRFLFIGPFSVIFEDTFFYKDAGLNKLQKAYEQPGLGFALQADTIFHGDSITLIPVNPFIKRYFAPEENKLSDYFFYDPLTRIFFLSGLLVLIVLCFRTIKVTWASWQLFRQKKTNKSNPLNSALKQLLQKCSQENQKTWINLMYAMLAEEKAIQKKIEQWIVRLTVLTALSGLLLSVVRFFDLITADVITSAAIIQAIVPLITTIILCITLLVADTFIITVHRLFLIRLEDSSWKLLFSRESPLNKK